MRRGSEPVQDLGAVLLDGHGVERCFDRAHEQVHVGVVAVVVLDHRVAEPFEVAFFAALYGCFSASEGLRSVSRPMWNSV